jgi:ABC-2 type transport system permease protein
MIGLIARREFTEYWRDGRLLWAGGLMLVLLLTALSVGWQRQAVLQNERVAAQALDYDDWVNQPARHPHDAAHQGMNVFKPEPPLSIIDPGIVPYVGSTLWLQAHRQSETKFRPAQDATGLQRFGSLSAAWVLQVLGPLLIVVLGFSAFAGEREQGTLRQVMSLGVSSRQLLLGKALALGLALAALLLPAVIVASAAVIMQADHNRVDAVLRLIGLGLGYVLYLGIAIFVVLAISSRAKTSRGALIILIAVWIGGVVLMPRALSDLTDSLYPTPSRTQFSSGLGQNLSDVQGQIWREKFGVSSAWSADLPLNKWGVALAENDRAGYGVLDRHFGALWDMFERQQTAQEVAGLVAPLLAIRSWSMALAGTDFAQHRDFSVAAETQRRLIQDIVSHDLVEHADPLGDQHFSYDAGSELWAEVPPFHYHGPAIDFALKKGWFAFLVLGIGLALSAAAALVFVPRQPV